MVEGKTVRVRRSQRCSSGSLRDRAPAVATQQRTRSQSSSRSPGDINSVAPRALAGCIRRQRPPFRLFQEIS